MNQLIYANNYELAIKERDNALAELARVSRERDGAVLSARHHLQTVEQLRILLAAAPEQAPIQSVPDAIDRYDLVETQYGSGYMTTWEKALELDPSGEWCKFADVQRMLATAPTPPAAPADKLTECRHCGFYVALNRAPADAPAAPTLTDAEIDGVLQAVWNQLEDLRSISSQGSIEETARTNARLNKIGEIQRFIRAEIRKVKGDM